MSLRTGSRRLQKIGAIVFSLPVKLLMTFSSLEAGSIYTLDFENNSLVGLPKTSLCCSHSARTVSWPVSTRRYAVKFVLNSYDKGYIYNVWRDPVVRAELQLNNIAHIGDRRWYGFSVYIDPSWNYDYGDNTGTIVAQWHTNTD